MSHPQHHCCCHEDEHRHLQDEEKCFPHKLRLEKLYQLLEDENDDYALDAGCDRFSFELSDYLVDASFYLCF